MFTAALAVKVAGTPPNPPPDESEKLQPTGSERLFSKTIPWTPVIAQVSGCIKHSELVMLTFLSDFLLDMDSA